MKRTLHITAIAAIITSLMLMTTACKDNSDHTVKSADREIPVNVITVAPSDNEIVKTYIGTIEEHNSVALSFQAMGNIQTLNVSEGDFVEKGRLLGSLDKTTLQSAHNAAKSTLNQAEDAYKRVEKIYNKGSLPEIKWVDVQSKLQQARSMEEIARKALENADMYAPFSGIIDKQMLHSGANVIAGTPIFRLVNIDKVKVTISIPENEISKVNIGDRATISVEAIGDSTFSGYITEKNVSANPLSHTYKAKMTINNDKHLLMPGMVCKVHISANDKISHIVVPNQAIQLTYDNRKFVWLADGGKAVRRFVEVGEIVKEGVVVKEGLVKGDMVVVDGMNKLSEGMKLTVR